MIFNLWVYCYNQLKLKFGLRGDEVVEIERKRGIGKKDKRVRIQKREQIIIIINKKNKKITKALTEKIQ